MRRFDLAAIACVTLIAWALPGSAVAGPPDADGPPRHGWGGHRGPGPESFLEEHGDELGLDAATRAAITKIVDESRARSEKLRAEARDNHQKMRALLQQPTPDEDAVMKLSESMNATDLALRQNRLRAILEIHGLLTEEQRAKLVAIREERRSHGRPYGMRGCRDDVAKVCPDAEPGRAMLQCLSEKWDELSPACQDGLEGGGRRGFRGSDDPDD